MLIAQCTRCNVDYTKLDSSGDCRERRVMPILMGMGRATGGLSRLSYLKEKCAQEVANIFERFYTFARRCL